MSDTATIGHNRGISLPSDEEMLAELQRKYPEIEREIGEFEKALATFPDELTLEQPDVAEALQDLLGQMKKTQKVWSKAHAPAEKGPLNKLVKVVTNFFTKADERMDGMLDTWAPRYQAYLDKKKVAAERKMAEEAEKQRQAAEAARLAAEAAEEERRKSEARAAEERRKEQEAREAAERAAREKEEAEARAAAAKEEERRLAAEKAAKDRAEKEGNVTALREIKALMKTAEKLHLLGEADEATEDEIKALDELIRPGGTIGTQAGPVASSALLDDDQRTDIEAVRGRLTALRDAINARFNKREQTRREKERKIAEEADAKLAEERRLAREAEDKKLAEARAKREEEEAAVERAKQEKKDSEARAREARGEARSAESGAKAAGKTADRHETDAQRADNRADRVENKLENSTDAELSRSRGDLGTVGSLTRRWAYYITDEAALRAVSGPLGEHLTTTALEGATFHWMRAHQPGWAGQTRVENALPGVVFAYEQEARIV